MLQMKRWIAKMLRKMDAWHWGKPVLGYFEFHLTDHCNMNCRRCAHFACLAEPYFADLEAFRRDLKRMRELFYGVRVIRLMGGEPLLHPDVIAFMEEARAAFPKARIHLVSNGLLADRMSEKFWTACRANRVIFQVTVYPPLGDKRFAAICELCKKQGVRLEFSRTDEFAAWLNRKGDSPLDESFAECRKTIYCPLLKDGRMYVCATAAFVGFYNKRFGTAMPADEGIDLNEAGISGREILKRLDRPVAMCRYCALKKQPMPWANSTPRADDWFVKDTPTN